LTGCRRSWGASFQGRAHAGRPLLVEGGLDWKPLSLSPKDMDFAESRAAAAREIALAFGVPPMMLGLQVSGKNGRQHLRQLRGGQPQLLAADGAAACVANGGEPGALAGADGAGWGGCGCAAADALRRAAGPRDALVVPARRHGRVLTSTAPAVSALRLVTARGDRCASMCSKKWMIRLFASMTSNGGRSYSSRTGSGDCAGGQVKVADWEPDYSDGNLTRPLRCPRHEL
jgi:hypothetical protein